MGERDPQAPMWSYRVKPISLSAAIRNHRLTLQEPRTLTFRLVSNCPTFIDASKRLAVMAPLSYCQLVRIGREKRLFVAI